jgi:hypothetical protein
MRPPAPMSRPASRRISPRSGLERRPRGGPINRARPPGSGREPRNHDELLDDDARSHSAVGMAAAGRSRDGRRRPSARAGAAPVVAHGGGSARPGDRSGRGPHVSSRPEDDRVVGPNGRVAVAASRLRDDPVFQAVGRGTLDQDRHVAGRHPIPIRAVQGPDSGRGAGFP